MSERKRRLDTQTRIQNDPERRKRRNLSDYPGLDFGSAVPEVDVPPSACPNIGPSDAGPLRCTVQGTGNPTNGLAYADVQLGLVGTVPGQDIISYCYDARVGPGTGPIECYCDGYMGLVTDGILFDSGMGFPDDSWESRLAVVGNVSFYRWQDVNGFWWLQTTGLFQVGSEGYWYIHPAAGQMIESDEMWVVAQYDSVGLGYVPGSGVVEGCYFCNWDLQPTGCFGHRGHSGLLACKSGGLDGWGGEDTHAHGIFGCTSGNSIALWNGGVPPSYGAGQNAYMGDPSLWKQNSSTDATTVRHRDQRGGTFENTSTNTSKDGQSGTMALYNHLHDGEGGGFRIAMMAACRSRVVKVQGLPTGYWARCTGPQRPTTFLQAPHLEAEESGGTATMDFTGNHPPYSTWEIYDGDPTGGGSLIQSCDIPRGIWGGDVFEYFPSGDCSDAEVVANVEGYIKMEVFDVSDTLLFTNVPTEVANTTGWVRKNGVLGYALPGNAQYLRFTPVKTGTADAFACFQKLQVNLDAICCAYTAPSTGQAPPFSQIIADPSTLVVAEGGEVAGTDQDGKQFIAQLWDDERQVIVTAADVGAGVEEHRQGQQNIIGFDGDAERDGPGNGTVGNPSTGCGYEYDWIDMVEWGIEAGDPLSLRFKGKVV